MSETAAEANDQGGLEKYIYDEKIVRLFVGATILWALVATPCPVNWKRRLWRALVRLTR